MGKFFRDNGHKRVPDPPHKMTLYIGKKSSRNHPLQITHSIHPNGQEEKAVNTLFGQIEV